tara:strand:+ start:255 stop:449 length:195 start_codon:yes stop_codon:yes gene_type:complete
MNNPTLPVIHINSLYDQGMDAMDIFEALDELHTFEAILECVLDHCADDGDDFISDDDAGEDAYY